MWIDWAGRTVPMDTAGLQLRVDGRAVSITGRVGASRLGDLPTVVEAEPARLVLAQQLAGLAERRGIVPGELHDTQRQTVFGDMALSGWYRVLSSAVSLSDGALDAGGDMRWDARLEWVGQRPARWFDFAVRDESFGNNIPGYQAAWGFPSTTSVLQGQIVVIDRDQGARALPTGLLTMIPAPSYTPAAMPTGSPGEIIRVDQLTNPAQLAYARVGSVRWDAAATAGMNGACYVASVDTAGVAHPTPGLTVTATQATPSSWEIGNGLVRFRQSATAGRITVEWFSGGVWGNLRQLSFGTGTAVPAWLGVQVVRNTHEAATIRLIAADRRGGSVEITVIRGRVGAYLQVDTPPGDPATTGLFASMNTASVGGLEHGLIAGPVTLIGRGNVLTPTYSLTAATGTIENAVSATQRLFAITCGGVAGFPSATASREELRAPLALRESRGR
jgi:hypothetical protein